MELRQLRYLLQVARSGSLSAAGAVLRIAQPALSRHMQALETDLGVVLFRRTGRGVELTSAGRAVAEDAARLLDEAEALGRRARGYSGALAGEATVGLPPAIGRLIALPLALRVRADHPLVRLRIVESFSGTLLEWLRDGRLDAAVLYHRPAAATIHSEVLSEERLSLIGANGAEFPDPEEVAFAALAGLPLVLSAPHHELRRLLEARATEEGIALNVVIELDSLDATIALVRQGVAFTVLSEGAVAVELAAQTLASRAIVKPSLIRPLVVASAAQRGRAVEIGALIRLIRETLLDQAGIASGIASE